MPDSSLVSGLVMVVKLDELPKKPFDRKYMKHGPCQNKHNGITDRPALLIHF